MKIKNIITNTVPVLVFSLIASLLSCGNLSRVDAAANPLIQYSLGNVLQNETVSDIDFTSYAVSIVYPGETKTTEGIMVRADYYAHDDDYDNIDTSAVMAAYKSFLTNTDTNADSVEGIIIESDLIEITEPIDLDYVEVNADFVWYGSIYGNMDDTESMRINKSSVSVTSKYVYINSEYSISLDNQYEDKWNCPNVDLYGSDVYLANNPFTNAAYNVIGNKDILYLSTENTTADFVNINFTRASDDNTFSATTISLDGSSFEETYNRNTETISYVDITFDTQGGNFTEEDPKTVSIEKNGYIADFPKVEREGYTLAGWYAAANGGSAVYSIETAADDIYITSFPENTTIYAHWLPNKYNVTLKLEDGTTECHEDVEYDSVIDFFPELENENSAIILKGWVDADKEDAPLLQPGSVFTYAYNVTLSPVWEDTNCKHEDTELINVKETTCTAEGYSGDIHCRICDNIIEFGKVIEKTEHSDTELINVKAVTCSETGYTGDHACTECGKILIEGEIITKLPHTLNEGKITKQPTETEEGQKTYTCTVCGKKVFTILSKIDSSGNTTEKPVTDTSHGYGNIPIQNIPISPTELTDTSKTATEANIKSASTVSSIDIKTGTTVAASSAKRDALVKAAKNKKAAISSIQNVSGRKIKVKIKKIKGYTYQIKVSTSKNFKKSKTVTYISSKNSKTITKFKGKKPAKNKTYYVKVRTVKKIVYNGKTQTVYGKWSKKKSIKMK